jgi:hypothetical protein
LSPVSGLLDTTSPYDVVTNGLTPTSERLTAKSVVILLRLENWRTALPSRDAAFTRGFALVLLCFLYADGLRSLPAREPLAIGEFEDGTPIQSDSVKK